MLVFILSTGILTLQAQVINRTFSQNTLVVAPDIFRVQNGLIAHDGNPVNVVTGAGSFVGTFGATAKWIGIGAPVTPGNLLYGERTQWNEQAFAKALRQRSATDVTKDAILEWGGGVASQVNSEMQFRHITNPTLPTGFTRILTMQTSGNSYFGINPPSGTVARLGVATANQRSFSCSTTNNTAGYFRSVSNANNVSLRGVLASVNGGAFTGGSIYAVAGIVSGTAANTRPIYGIYGRAPVSGTAGFGTTNTSYAGFFQGDVYITSSQYGSDAKYKINVVTETNALSKILAVRPVAYNFDTVQFRDFNFSSRRQHGFIAQEIQTVFPEAVQTARLSVQDEEGNETLSNVGLSLNYIGLISTLYRGIQEQQTQINELRQRLGLPPVTAANAGTLVAAANNTGGVAATEEPVAGQRISTAAGTFTAADFKMEQNVPNPFSGSTVIRYTLPNNVSNAFIGIYNLQGSQLLRFDRLNGGSQITINGNALQPGIYVYALVVEGQEVMSKRMVVSR